MAQLKNFRINDGQNSSLYRRVSDKEEANKSVAYGVKYGGSKNVSITRDDVDLGRKDKSPVSLKKSPDRKDKSAELEDQLNKEDAKENITIQLDDVIQYKLRRFKCVIQKETE